MSTKYTVEQVKEWQAVADAQAKLYSSMKGAHEPWQLLALMLGDYAEHVTQQPDEDMRIAQEGLEYFHRTGDAGDKEYVRAIRIVLNNRPVPDGWKLVPIVPTIDMVESGMTEILKPGMDHIRFNCAWRAALSVAPENN